MNHPDHYVGFSNGAEVIDITENLSFNLGNVVKYVARAGRKDPAKLLEDLRKAQFYLDREIERLDPEESTWNLTVRQWQLLDHVPPNVIVQDTDGDYYRRVQGTGHFEICIRENVYGQFYEWQPLWANFFRVQGNYAPFTEVTSE